ncbi:non-ribosomal peptide synthetase [Streptacidiphilus jiangxiensis]|uniref:Amino acid adenylation domain-containing protein n=1 Tax=Streptacidiphilus jiangxiensis TaxID=235985 RepID=A0A1H7JI47_STRJI|nr:non-ribosomal peptide synthetase [Streptacidiphilus jiangxiensis]SEK74162.1 amino acid adenylation domain-containing protein [Streptacidiphilus jiangxiensis]
MPDSIAVLNPHAAPPRCGTVRELPATTVLGLFESRAAAEPSAPALYCAGARLTYGELDAAAEALAERLRGRGVGAGSRVAVCLDRSPDLLTGLLAVWKAGGVHLPVDLGYPAERITHLLTDSGAVLALSRSDLQDRLPAASTVPTLLTDRSDPRASAVARPGLTHADPAHLIYTSGSTGLPKGVLNSHGALLNVVLELGREMPCEPGDRWLAMAAAGFDIAMAEFCVPLATGAELVLPTEDELRDPRRLVALIDELAVTRMQAVPSQWRLLLDAGFDAPELVAMVGGESLGVNLAQELRGRVAALFNGYGPTETTVLSTLWRVPAQVGSVSLGLPIANTRLHLLGPDLAPVPDGATGELCIAGAGVADGYPNRPELTAERFVPEPARTDGALMYRTGDLCRWRADGTLEFLGRSDGQVKVNGRRIELGEVESALSAMPGVTGVCVAVHDQGDAGAALVAYLVPAAGAQAPDPAGVRAFGRDRLPAALVPGLVVVLDAFPLTPHGKVDRAALPAPLPAASDAGPVDGVTGEVCALLGRILSVPTVRPEDDPADLGATSLSLMQLSGRLHERWGVDVSPDDLLEATSVDAIAALVRASRG